MSDRLLGTVLSAGQLYHDYLRTLEEWLCSVDVHDIDGTRAMMIMGLGRGSMTPGRILHSGIYVGTNLTYNMKILVANGWWSESFSCVDRRTKFLRNTEKGLELCDHLSSLVERHTTLLGLEGADLAALSRSMRIFQSAIQAKGVAA